MGLLKHPLVTFCLGRERFLPTIHVGMEDVAGKDQGQFSQLENWLSQLCVMPLPVSHHLRLGFCISPWAVLVSSRAGLMFDESKAGEICFGL